MYFIKDNETLQSLIAFPLHSEQWTIKGPKRPFSHGMIQNYVNIHRITQNLTESQNHRMVEFGKEVIWSNPHACLGTWVAQDCEYL